MAGLYQTTGAHMPSRTRCTRMVKRLVWMQVGCRLRCFRLTYSARCFSSTLPHFNDCSNYCGLSGAWADKCLSCNKSPQSCIPIWWARAGVCTADPVSACCCTSFDLVQCRGKGGGDNRDPSLQFSLLQYATSPSTPFIFMPYTAILSS